MRFIKKFIKHIIYGNKCDSETYIKFLKKRGCKIGNHVTIYAPENTVIDLTRPFLIEVGNNVEITSGCVILTHGYDWSVFKTLYGDVMGSAGKVKIGNNVFVGVNTTILKDVIIGSNVVIGANSLINKNIPDNVVVAGNPAKIICTIDEYYSKRKNLQLDEAYTIFISYKKAYSKIPPIDIFYEFFWIFENDINNRKFYNIKFQEMMELGGTFNKSYEKYMLERRLFDSYDSFIEYCIFRERNENKTI